MDEEAFLATIDAARWAGIAATEDIVSLASAMVRHPGAVQVRRFERAGLLELESGGERRLDDLLSAFETRPERQVRIAPDVRVDLLFREDLLVVEYAGRRHHRGSRDRERDARRDERIRALGYEVLHVNAEDLADPASLRGRMRTARARARAGRFPA